jgi:hypothetical protein
MDVSKHTIVFKYSNSSEEYYGSEEVLFFRVQRGTIPHLNAVSFLIYNYRRLAIHSSDNTAGREGARVAYLPTTRGRYKARRGRGGGGLRHAIAPRQQTHGDPHDGARGQLTAGGDPQPLRRRRLGEALRRQTPLCSRTSR